MKDPTAKQMAMLCAMSDSGGGLDRGSRPWIGAAAEGVVMSLLRDDFVTTVKSDSAGNPRRVELNLHGREAVTDAQQLAKRGAA